MNQNEGSRRDGWNSGFKREGNGNQQMNQGRGSTRSYRGWTDRGGKGNSSLGKGSGRRRQLNPTDENGEVQTCNICKSVYHFAGYKGQNCPESYENQKKVYQSAESEEGYKCDGKIDVNDYFIWKKMTRVYWIVVAQLMYWEKLGKKHT